MRNGNSIKPEEDLFQKSLHQEADFFKGMEKHHYKSIASFFFASLMSLFISLAVLLTMSIVVAGAIAAIQQQKVSLFILGGIVALFWVVLLGLIAFKLLRKLVSTFIVKDKEFKTKAILLLIIPACLFVFIFILILPIIFSMGFTF